MTTELELLITTIVPKMEGWATTEKALSMAELILEVRPSVVVELGVFAGRSLIPQALALKEEKEPFMSGLIYGVDPWHVQAALEGDIGEANAEWWRTAPNLDLMHQLCVNEIWKHGLDHHAILIRGRAHEVWTLFRSGIDILHFDQNHSEFASMRDIQLYYPLVRPGGYIWFDDTDWATTQKALNLLSERAISVKDVGTCRLFRKETVHELAQKTLLQA